MLPCVIIVLMSAVLFVSISMARKYTLNEIYKEALKNSEKIVDFVRNVFNASSLVITTLQVAITGKVRMLIHYCAPLTGCAPGLRLAFLAISFGIDIV